MLKAQSLVPMPSNDDRPVGETQARPSNALMAAVFAVEKKYGSTIDAPDDDPLMVRVHQLAHADDPVKKPGHNGKEVDAGILRLARLGYSQEKIATLTHTSRGYVQSQLRIANEPNHSQEAILYHLEHGMSYSEIAELLGFKETGVLRFLSIRNHRKALEMVREGRLSNAEIARKLGIRGSSLQRWISVARTKGELKN
ncbi:hypothetical protein [Lacticaseibacillus absianus]|uniref:hypothetical protein n=1 Tax=Lacticaseibacillus absianus TaxID=2729623 RepID=UPI0015CA2A3E|nr:hypothetical protein [Lacticaseibacillus absianus]